MADCKRDDIITDAKFCIKELLLNGFESLEVENIIDTKVGKDHRRHYLVCFKSWLPEEDLNSYGGLIEQYWRQHKNENDLNYDDNESSSDKENQYSTHIENKASVLSSVQSCYGDHFKIESSKLPPIDPISKNSPNRDEPTVCFNDNDINEKASSPDSSSNEEVNIPAKDNGNCYDKDSQLVIEERSSSDCSDRAQSSCSDRPPSNCSDHQPIKKRKLKSLDDIVRKISGTNDVSVEKKSTIEAPLTDRLQTLDETLLDSENSNEVELKKPRLESGEQTNRTELHDNKQEDPMDDSMNCGERAMREQFANGTASSNGEKNIYWSGGKAFHKPTRSFKCQVCDHRFDCEDSLKEHQQTHEVFSCRNCNQVFWSYVELNEHRLTAHKPRQKYHKCRYCSTLHSDPVMLERHEKGHFSTHDVHHSGIDAPPPLMSIQENREFSQFENRDERDIHDRTNMIDPNEVLRSTPGENKSNSLEKCEGKNEKDCAAERDERTSIVRNPIRNLLGKMYHSQKRTEHERDFVSQRYSLYAPTPPDNCAQSQPEPINQQQSHPERHTRHEEYYNHRMSPGYQQQQIRRIQYEEREGNHESGESNEKDPQSFRELVHLCPICKKSFGKKETFDHHWETAHSDVTRFSCELCDETFFNKDVFESHMSSHVKQEFICELCKKCFDRKSTYDTHVRTHTQERPFQCDICARSFSLRTNLRRHVLIHTDITPYQCQLCSKGFRRSDMLNCHMKQYHNLVKSDSGNHRQVMEPISTVDERYLIDRNHGNMNGSKSPSPVYHRYDRSEPRSPAQSSKRSRENLFHNDQLEMIPPLHSRPHYMDETTMYPYARVMRHSPNGHNMNHSPNGPTIHHSPNTSAMHDVGNVPMHHTTNGPGIYHRSNGSTLPESYDQKSEQLIQMDTVAKQSRNSPVKPSLVNILPQPPHRLSMECRECGEQFTSASLYEIHMQSHVKEAYSCEKCRKSFSNRNQYETHVQWHETNKSHNCPYCHRSFSMKGNLRRHIRIHTNEAPYECPICFQRFRRSDGLKGHIKRHETMGESAPNDMVPSQASA